MKKVMLLVLSFKGIEEIIIEIIHNNNDICVIGFIKNNNFKELKKYLSDVCFLGSIMLDDIENTISSATTNRIKKKISLLVNDEKKKLKKNIKVNMIFNLRLEELEKVITIYNIEYLFLNLPKDKNNMNRSSDIFLRELKENFKIPFRVYYNGDPYR